MKVSCQCHYVKEVQNYYINNFSHVVNGAEFIEDLSDGMKTGGSMKFKDMWEALKPTMQYDKSCDKPGCQYKNSKIETFILDPLPQIFVLNFNWGNPELSAKDLLRVYMSFRDNVTMSLFYQMSPETKKSEPEYSLTSFICFQGAHYYIFVAEKSDQGLSHKWRLYNDTFVERFEHWSDVVAFCLNSKCLPTVLMYEVL